MPRKSDERTIDATSVHHGNLRVLHVDSVDWLTRVREYTGRDRDGISVAGASTGRDALETLESQSIDCVVTDVSLPDFDLIDFLDALESIDPGVPVVLYTGEGPESVPDGAVDRIDTILQRSPENEGLEFLVRKVRTAVESRDDEDASRALGAALGLVLLSAEGDVAWSNEAFDALFPADDGDGRPDVETRVAATLEDPASFVDRRRDAMRDGSTVGQIDLAATDPRADEERVIEYRSHPVSGPPGVARIEQFRDVTREREFEAEREKLETLETLVETARDGLYILDANGDFAYCNDSFAEMAGYEREELLGKHGSIPQKEGELEDGQRAIQRLLESDEGESDVYDMVFETEDGEEWIGEINFALLPTEDDGDYGGLVGVVRDVTERREQEEQLRRQRERLEKFASIVAHDLRNPLTLLQASLEGMDDGGDEALLEDARRSADRMDRMIDDLLELAGAGEVVGDPEPVDLAAVCEECWRRSPVEEATLHLEDDLGTVEADRGRLAELLENLFRNAIEHGSADVTVTVGPLEGREGFSVADDGPGIPDDRKGEVFDHGFTSSPDGTGFGLSIVAEIVEAHGWSIEIRDAESGGARFEIETDDGS